VRHVNYTLKPAIIDNAKPRVKAYALTDGGLLQIEILPSGGKTWRFNYHLHDKREKVAIGSYPAFAIKQPRDRREELCALVARGQSPAKAKQAAAASQKLVEARRLLLRSDEVLSGIAHPAILEVAHHALGVLLQHRHVIVGRFP
jgi:hypothetical protein